MVIPKVTHQDRYGSPYRQSPYTLAGPVCLKYNAAVGRIIRMVQGSDIRQTVRAICRGKRYAKAGAASANLAYGCAFTSIGLIATIKYHLAPISRDRNLAIPLIG